MGECKGCENCKKFEGTDVLYEDDVACAVIPKKPCAKGHIQIITKKHYKSFETIPDKEVEHLFYIASFSATTLFETLKPEGTNIIFSTGNMFADKEERIVINVIARNYEDGMNFLWNPKQIDETEVNQAQEKIKEKCSMIGVEVKEKKVLDLDKSTPEKISAEREDKKEAGKEKSAEEKGKEEIGEGKKESAAEEKYKKHYEKGKKAEELKEEKESYLVKQLRRVP